MGTAQELTTEQVEVLILIDAINKYLVENNAELTVPMSETIDGCITTENGCVETCKVLENYGYTKSVGNDYALTVDGKQYINLFKEYLEAKAVNSIMIHNSFSLINLENLKMNIEACLGKIDFSLEIPDWFKALKSAIQSITRK